MSERQEPWTLINDIEAQLVGIEANELVEPFREYVAAADEMARVLSLFFGGNDESARVQNSYWRARNQEVPG